MEPIIDVHSHILPGIDDGARRMWETRELIKQAYGQGIRTIIATPHFHRGKHYIEPGGILELTQKVQREADKLFPDMNIYAGQELIYFHGIFDEVAAGKTVPMAGSDCFLMEFQTDTAYETIYQAVRQMSLMRYRPMLAHIERYPCLRTPGRIEELRKSGAYMQMNFSSLSGGIRYVRETLWCRRMVQEGKIQFLGTDMHRVDFRPPKTGKAVEWIYRRCGEDEAVRMMMRNPMEILIGDARGGNVAVCGGWA
ncbi:hypothetical protein GPL15_22410 [Clostridium sp. MCC353]|uniref:CpsB/CapC family capsule biosynthesis tyrosine phosphatase n=1 Tax=Clostridium sp. MCC353 TaxID=2592646 RepID=UPI001C02A6B6|nr:CpsB/CapC family capsule biosynthesis tyrosine phosphatase [Clostridium sp. MCC353]MBT9779235.1 hypothetical protein [Clostridium sp. MCC353]